MQLIYVEHLKGYIDIDSKHYPGDVLTEEDLDLFLDLEKVYRENLPEYNFHELIKFYPSAKSAMKRNIIAKEKALKEKKKKIIEYYENTAKKIFGKLPPRHDAEITTLLENEKNDKLDDLSKELSQCKFQKQYLARLIKEENLQKKVDRAKKKNNEALLKEAEEKLQEMSYEPRDGITGEMIERARSIPISNFVKVGRDGKIKCLKHNERTASMHIYNKKNNFYCFSCGWHGSVIDIVMQLRGFSFKEAVEYLNNV